MGAFVGAVITFGGSIPMVSTLDGGGGEHPHIQLWGTPTFNLWGTDVDDPPQPPPQ